MSLLHKEGQKPLKEKEKTFLDIVCETSDIIEKKRLQGTEYDYKYFTGIFDLDKATITASLTLNPPLYSSLYLLQKIIA